MSIWEINMEAKKQIREELKNRRKNLESSFCKKEEEQILLQLRQSDVLCGHGYIYGYYPHGKELSILPVLQWALEAGKRVALPKVAGDTMDFYEITSLEEVAKGSFGVMEPVTAQRVNWEEAVCLTPGVGFDKAGNRMGHGAGYYDKYFEHHRRLIKVGIAYDFQIKDMIPTEETDIRMDYLMTPSQCKKVTTDS